MSNFDFLKEYDYDLWNFGDKLEHDLILSPASVVTNATRFLERVVELLIDETGTEVDLSKEYYYRLDAVYREGHIKYGFKQSIYDAYQLRNKIHNTDSREIERTELPMAMQLHKKLFYIGKKLYSDFYKKDNTIPSFVPVEVDTSASELELIDIPDFSEIIDINYDYCIICGEPNHSNDSLCCHKCNRVMDNANTFISVRNHFGKTAKFSKDDLIRFGIPEGYVNQFISSLVRENMLKVTGRDITFNNIGLDGYLSKIDSYINICELITKFREDKILARDIKQTIEYREGSRKNEPFYQFYKITNREIIKKFERDLLTTEDIWKSIEYTTITENQLSRWYKRELGKYNRGTVNDSFIIFNDLLKREYLDMKREGILDNEIKARLNVTREIYDFWIRYDQEFTNNIREIKIDLLTKAISEGKRREEIIESAGVTQKEYDDIVKVANFNNTDFAKLRNKEIESRKGAFIRFLKNNALKSSCHLAKFTLDDFYQYYDEADVESEFHIKSTQILMDKFLAQRRLGKTRHEATEFIGIKKQYVDRWFKRSAYKQFRNDELKITVNLIIRGFKQNKSIVEISEVSGIAVERIETFLRLGERGDELYKPLFEYYENHIIPKKLDDFLNANKTKSIRKALESAHLKKGELDKYYGLGKDGDERFSEFYKTFLEVKKKTYVSHYERRKSHKLAMKESYLAPEEYESCKEIIDKLLRLNKITTVIECITDDKTSNIAATKAGCSVDEIYEWYFRGRGGDENYEKFYNIFHKTYVKPAITALQEGMDKNQAHLDFMIKVNKKNFTKKDVEIWVKNGLLDNNVLVLLDNSKDDDDEKEKESEYDADEMLKEMGVENYDRISTRKTSGSSSILNKKDYDAEELKRQILKK